MALSKSADLPKAIQVVVPCGICPSGDPGKYYCMVCKDTLCSSCKILHARKASSKYHQVVFRSEKGAVAASQSTDICKDHMDHMVVMQCQKCNVLVCLPCVSDTHKGHPVIGITEVYEIEKIILQERLKEMEANSLPLLTKAIIDTRQKKDAYNKNIENIKKEMEEELEELKREADRINEQRLNQLERIKSIDLNIIIETESKLMNQECQIKKAIAEYKALLASGSQVELIMYSHQSRKSPHLNLDTTIPKPPQFQPVNLKIIDLSDILGKLNTADQIPTMQQDVTPKMISSFKTGLEGLVSFCITKDGNTWVGGYESRKLNLMNIKGKILRSRTVRDPPYCLAIMESNEIILSPNAKSYNAIMRLRADSSEEMVYDASPSWCNGLSVTRDQKILICTDDGRVVMCDGTGTKQIYKGPGSIVHGIMLPDKTICVSDNAYNQIHVIGRSGRVFRSITKPLGRTNFSPRGLAFDVMSNVLATDYTNDCVYLIRDNGDIGELVGKSHGIKGPYWLSIDKDNNLWIGQENGKLKIVKYLH